MVRALNSLKVVLLEVIDQRYGLIRQVSPQRWSGDGLSRHILFFIRTCIFGEPWMGVSLPAVHDDGREV